MMLPHMIPYAEPFIFSFSHCACTDRSIFIDMGKKITSLSISSDTFLFICQLWR